MSNLLLKSKNAIGLFFLAITVSLPILAADVYVYDKAKLWSRTGPSNEYKVYIQLLPGTRLEVIGENTQTGFTQVKDRKDREFWVKSEYLSSTPTANILLNDALNKIDLNAAKYQSTVQSLEQQITTMKPLGEINESLQAKIAEMELELEQLRLSNKAISGRFYRELFFAGGLTVLAGMFLGWAFGARGKKRNDGWR